MLTHAQNANGIRFRDDACWVLIDLNARVSYIPAVIRVGNIYIMM